MEFDFPIQDILQHEITCIDGSLTPDGFQGDDHNSYTECQSKISIILDKIGYASGIAQGLQTAVTSSERLKNTQHRVYLLCDPHAGQNGQVIGLLKVGHKKLYVFDQTGSQHELHPLCVLDFYVHESKQRHGCGKHLYEYMLQAEGVKPGHLAFDRPSDKLLSFLVKHYGLITMIPQSNNFVVYDTFFDARSGVNNNDNYKHVPMDFGSSRPAAGCGTVHRDAKVQSSRRAAVMNRPHSSISKIMDTNGGYASMDGQESMIGGDMGDLGSSLEHMSPLKSPTHSLPPLSCSADVEASELQETPSRRDIKFQHQRLW